MNYLLRLIICSILLGFFFSCVKKDEGKLRLIVLTGTNNHDWKATTKQLKTMYNESGRFEVHVTESPDTLGYNDFKKFDVVLSNWNPWPENKVDWPDTTKQGLMKYIESGGGFVLFHAASAAFYDWKEFHELIGGTWFGRTRHGKITDHEVIIDDKDHPITKGLSNFRIKDELWVEMKLQDSVNILASSFSKKDNNGRDMMEPVMFWNLKGTGRCFYNVLGHNVEALENEHWKKIMLRGTEWAATGKVSNF
ncbi:ThuA domain-containing protein [Seonamhaeicola sp.]|uniref:ThuA domain-containing protein n=1 Tax=Seonamhaeicola sp. TaxID=1912245 RepID=UPI00260A1CFE|nr:ThuA domain-containing protein [Seonamhaeicola sp.]